LKDFTTFAKRDPRNFPRSFLLRVTLRKTEFCEFGITPRRLQTPHLARVCLKFPNELQQPPADAERSFTRRRAMSFF
jgi:hypothetical protein